MFMFMQWVNMVKLVCEAHYNIFLGHKEMVMRAFLREMLSKGFCVMFGLILFLLVFTCLFQEPICLFVCQFFWA
jgi:hypothetical protein